MTTVCEKGKCTGCMECIDICPKKAIKVIDSWQEYNAVIDTEQCIQCNACHNACQNNVKQILNQFIGNRDGRKITAFACVLHLEGWQQQ